MKNILLKISLFFAIIFGGVLGLSDILRNGLLSFDLITVFLVGDIILISCIIDALKKS